MKTYDEAKTFYLDNGVEEVEAERLAKAMFPEVDDTDDSEDETIQENNSLLKGISAKFAELKDTMLKSKNSDDIDDDDEEDAEEGDGNEFIEVGDVLNTITKSISDLIDFSHQKAEYDYERDEAFAKAIMQVDELKKSLTDITAGLTVTVGDKEIPLAKAVEISMKSRGGNIDLTGLEIAGDTIEKSNAVYSVSGMKWGELNGMLTKAVSAKKINSQEQNLVEAGWRIKDWKAIQPIVDKCKDE